MCKAVNMRSAMVQACRLISLALLSSLTCLTAFPLCFSCTTQYEGQDVLSDSQLFEALGVGLGPAEMYGVMLAQKRLGDDPLVGIKTVSAGAWGWREGASAM